MLSKILMFILIMLLLSLIWLDICVLLRKRAFHRWVKDVLERKSRE